MMKINSILDVIDNYDLIILDIFGVIHNGSELYPNVRATINELKQRNKTIIFL